MKISLVLSLFALLFVVLVMGFINGPANRGHDKTGSPLSSGKCFNCHSAGIFSPSLSIKMFDGENEVETYEPGKMYQLKYRIFNTGSPKAFGFQTVVLNSNNESTGNFDSIPSGFHVTTLNNANYLEHSTPRPLNTLNVYWKAPDNASDAITIYAGGVAANGNGNNGGDGGDVDMLVLQPNTSASSQLVQNTPDLFSINGNMVNSYLDIEIQNSNMPYQLLIFDQNGRMVQRVKNNFQDQKRQSIELVRLSQGIHFVQMRQNGMIETEKIIKL